MALTDMDITGWSHESLRLQAETVTRLLFELPSRVQAVEVSGDADNGSVVAFADGTGSLTRVAFEATTIRRYDARSVGRLVVEAICRAEDAALRTRQALGDEMTFAGHPIQDWLVE